MVEWINVYIWLGTFAAHLKLISYVCLGRSVVSDSVTPWTIAHQVPLSMKFSGQEYWSGLTVSSPGDLPNPGTEPRSPALQADFLLSEPPGYTPIKIKSLEFGKTKCIIQGTEALKRSMTAIHLTV